MLVVKELALPVRCENNLCVFLHNLTFQQFLQNLGRLSDSSHISIHGNHICSINSEVVMSTPTAAYRHRYMPGIRSAREKMMNSRNTWQIDHKTRKVLEN